MDPGVHQNIIKLRLEFHIEKKDSNGVKGDDEVEIRCARGCPGRGTREGLVHSMTEDFGNRIRAT